MTYLVTGGAGFIEFHLCKSLLDKGKKVTTVDNFTEYYDVNLKKDRFKEISKAKLYVGDISDYTFMKNVFQENGVNKIQLHTSGKSWRRKSKVYQEMYRPPTISFRFT